MKFVLLSVALACATAQNLPPPFTRDIYPNPSNPTTGKDVIIIQNLLPRNPGVEPFTPEFGAYDTPTVNAVKQFQTSVGIGVDGIFGPDTATHLLSNCSCDNWKPTNLPTPSSMGYKYAVHIPVHANRSVQTTGTLYDKDGNVLHTFVTRTHGHDKNGPNNWPHYSDTVGLTMFAGDGNTVTGLAEFDLNTPEDDHRAFGPYDIHRIVQGLDGNLKFMVNITANNPIRYGLLMHTGEWPGWTPNQVMPNSDGCIHIHPKDLDHMDTLLTTKYGIVAHKNIGGTLPYPYKPQGLIAVWQVDGC